MESSKIKQANTKHPPSMTSESGLRTVSQMQKVGEGCTSLPDIRHSPTPLGFPAETALVLNIVKSPRHRLDAVTFRADCIYIYIYIQ